MSSLSIRNAMLIDGTGAPARLCDVSVEDGKLRMGAYHADEVIDATGLYLCPGFIDAHSHGDIFIGSEYASLAKLSQGITTQVAGQCGISMFPSAEADMLAHGSFLSSQILFATLPSDGSVLLDFKRYTQSLSGMGLSLNLALFVGHNTLRNSVMGCANRLPNQHEMDRMKATLREAMEHGALGLSSGLVYLPGCYSNTEELVSLLSVVHDYNGIYASHIRNQSDGLLDAIDEAIQCAAVAGTAVNISHIKVSGRRNWGKSTDVLERIRNARAAGIRAFGDMYPYLAGMTALNVSIPPQYREGGAHALAQRLKDPALRDRIKTAMLDPDGGYENYMLNSGGFGGVVVASSPLFHDAEGMSIKEYAAKRKVDEFTAYFDVLEKNGGESSALHFHMCKEDMLAILSDPNVVIGTDGIYSPPGASGHPRTFATMVRAFKLMTEESHPFSLEEAIHKMTGLTAELLMLPNKGIVAEGYDADLVLFDLNTLDDSATFAQPGLLCSGIRDVFVNGCRAYTQGALTGTKAGKYTPKKA